MVHAADRSKESPLRTTNGGAHHVPATVEEAAAHIIEAVLLFHSPSPWTSDKRARWRTLTGADEATTKALCDFLRRTREALDLSPTVR